jgi:hypothetical protein
VNSGANRPKIRDLAAKECFVEVVQLVPALLSSKLHNFFVAVVVFFLRNVIVVIKEILHVVKTTVRVTFVTSKTPVHIHSGPDALPFVSALAVGSC